MIEVALPAGIRAVDFTPPPALRWIAASAWAPSQQVGDLQTAAAGWRVRCEVIADHLADHGRLWRAFHAQMRGPVNFCLLDPVNGAQAGLPSDALVAGAGQTGATLAVDGAAHDVRLVRAGDVVSIGGRGYTVAADALTDAAGATSLTLEPPVTVAPADDAPVLIRRPAIRFRLPDNQQGGWNLQPGQIETPAAFDMIEVLP